MQLHSSQATRLPRVLAVLGAATSSFGGGISAARINATATSTFSGLVVDSGGLRLSPLDCTSYANGGTLTTDASGNVVCAADDGGAGSTVAGADTQIQFNNGGSFGAAANFTFSSSTGKLAVPYASSTALTTGTQWFTDFASSGLGVDANGKVYAAPTSTLSTISGTLALTQLANQNPNTVLANGTAGSAAPTAIATSSLFAALAGQILGRVNGTWTGVATTTFSTGLTYANGAVTCDTASGSALGCLSSADWTTFNNKQAAGNYITALTGDVTASGPGSASVSFALGNTHWWTARQNFGNASTSQFTATSSVWFTSLGTPAGTFLAVDPNGLVIATSTPAVGGSGTITNIATTYPITGGPITTTGTLSLAFGTTTTNMWTHQIFSSLFATNASTTNATTTNFHITGLANSGLGVGANGKVYAAPTSTLATISGTLALTQLANQNANTVLANLTGASAAPTAISTTTLFSGTGGQVLAFLNGGWTGAATTTLTNGAGVTTTYDAGTNQWTITNTGATFAFPFTTSTTYGTTSAATSSSIQTAGVFFASSTAASSVFPFASSTALSATALCLSADCRTSWPTGGGSGDPFPIHTSYAGLTTSGTSSTLWLTGATVSLAASSSVLTFASSTAFTASGSGYFATDAGASVGIGTSTPWAKLALQADAGQMNPVFQIASSSLATSFLTVTGTGNVGLGSSSPSTLLTVAGTSTLRDLIPEGAYTTNLSAYNVGDTSRRWNSVWTGTLNIGTSTFSLKSDSASNLGFFTAANGGGTQALTLTSAGNVGIGTSPSGSSKLKVTASGVYGIEVTNANSGGVAIRGNASSNASAVHYGGIFEYTGSYSGAWGLYCGSGFGACGGDDAWTNTSDARLKTNVNELSALSGLGAIMQLRPVTYTWRDTGQEKGEQFGFIAQEVEPLFPSFVTTSGTTTVRLADGSIEEIANTKYLSYASFVVPLVKAVQELNLKLENLATTTPNVEPTSFLGRFFGALKEKLLAWFADAANGIAEFFAQVGNFGRVNTDKLCVGSTCITETQLAAVLTATGQSLAFPPAQSNAPEPAPAPTSAEPPPTDTATSTDSTSSPQAAATSSPPALEASTSPESTEVATSSPDVTESAASPIEPTTPIADSPPLAPEEEPEPPPTTTAASDSTEPAPASQ